ncbi:hypothetical protein VUR80DRAFT_10298 [Thermomyces stellatus]
MTWANGSSPDLPDPGAVRSSPISGAARLRRLRLYLVGRPNDKPCASAVVNAACRAHHRLHFYQVNWIPSHKGYVY